MITPEQLAASGTEQGHQSALMCWASLHSSEYPELNLLFAIPNGGTRDKREASRMKAAGVKAGVPDLCLPVARSGFHALYIEMKRPGERIKLGSKQELWATWLTEQGCLAKCCDNWIDARDWLISYLEDKEFSTKKHKKQIWSVAIKPGQPGFLRWRMK